MRVKQVMQIRRYQSEDIEAVKKLHYAGLRQIGINRVYNPDYDYDFDNLEETYVNNKGDFLVGLDNEDIVVAGAIRKKTRYKAEIKRIRVREDYQRQGYGGIILLKLIERARELGYKELYLDTLASNVPAQRLFQKYGFIETRRAKAGPYDLICYGKSLE